VVKKRDISDDEQALWDQVMRDVRRAKPRAVSTAKDTAKDKVRPTRVVERQQAPAKVPPPRVALPKPRRDTGGITGVDGATAERLRRGRIEPDATLDLHGMTQQQAFARLLPFVRRGHEKGYRCVLVITGKGAAARGETDEGSRGFAMPERSKAGVLRSQVPLWLELGETRSLVVGVQTAHQRHGGGGALYVYLRRKTSRGA
jgi:DNA-nicking Smr family endonuclease